MQMRRFVKLFTKSGEYMKTSKKIKYGLLLAIIAAWIITTPPSYKQHVKMTVTIATPEGDVTGSAVREISNSAPRIKIKWPHGGNPASVRGEAVVIDLGERGKVFSLINENAEEGRFYNAFPPPNGAPQSNETLKHYSQLPAGTSAQLGEQYWPGFITFLDMDKPQSVTVVWGSEFDANTQKYYPVNRIEELFGIGVELKNVSLEITDEPITFGMLDRYLDDNFWNEFLRWHASLSIRERWQLKLFQFKAGEGIRWR